MKRRTCGHVVFFVAVSVSVGLCGCAIARPTVSPKGTAAATGFVRKVDIHQAPEMKELAEHARQFGNEMYPKVLALLVDDNSTLPHHFDILFKLYNALGYLNGKPPRDVRIRFKAYLKQQPQTNDLLETAREMNGKPLKDVFRFYAFIRYFDDAAKFLQSQADEGRLPGFTQGELSETWPGMSDLEERCGEPYPMSRTFSCLKNGDPTVYHYIVARESKDALWKLKRARRTGTEGCVIKEYLVE